MPLMFAEGIRKGTCGIILRYSKANNKYMKNFNPTLPSKYIFYTDANNLYGWEMVQALPLEEFTLATGRKMQNWQKICERRGVGMFLEADLENPCELYIRISP